MKSQRVWKGDVGDRLSVSIVVNKQKLGNHVGPEVSVSYRGVCIAHRKITRCCWEYFPGEKIQTNTKRYLAFRFFLIPNHFLQQMRCQNIFELNFTLQTPQDQREMPLKRQRSGGLKQKLHRRKLTLEKANKVTFTLTSSV